MALAGLSAVAAATTLVSLLTWQGFTQNFGLTLGPLFLVAVVVAGTGAIARWWRVPGPLLVVAQLAARGDGRQLVRRAGRRCRSARPGAGC